VVKARKTMKAEEDREAGREDAEDAGGAVTVREEAAFRRVAADDHDDADGDGDGHEDDRGRQEQVHGSAGALAWACGRVTVTSAIVERARLARIIRFG
jgi:hypothetical protein